MEHIEGLLKKLVDGSITPGEEAYFFEWLRDNKEEWSLQYYDHYRILLEQKIPLLPEEKSASLLKALHKKIGADPEAYLHDHAYPVKQSPLPLGRQRWNRIAYWTIAASVALLLILGRHYIVGPNQVTDTPAKSIANARPIQKVTNNKKVIIPVNLPDGSSVLLYPESTLTFDKSFDSETRNVTLEGKAFFEVTRNPDQPFLVFTNEMMTRVLGTSFTVEAYANHPHFQVVVKTGKVTVSNTGKGNLEHQGTSEIISLKENEKATFDRNLQTFLAPTLESNMATIKNIPKTSTEYRFRDVPVMVILDKLSTDYGVEIHADKSVLDNCSLTATLKDKPLFEKLRIVCEAVGPGTTFSVVEGVVTISSLGCNN